MILITRMRRVLLLLLLMMMIHLIVAKRRHHRMIRTKQLRRRHSWIRWLLKFNNNHISKNKLLPVIARSSYDVNSQESCYEMKVEAVVSDLRVASSNEEASGTSTYYPADLKQRLESTNVVVFLLPESYSLNNRFLKPLFHLRCNTNWEVAYDVA